MFILRYLIILTPPLISCEIIKKSPWFFVPQFPHLQDGENKLFWWLTINCGELRKMLGNSQVLKKSWLSFLLLFSSFCGSIKLYNAEEFKKRVINHTKSTLHKYSSLTMIKHYFGIFLHTHRDWTPHTSKKYRGHENSLLKIRNTPFFILK